MSKHKRTINRTKAEPTMVRGLVVAILTLLASLGFTWAADVDKETLGALVVVAGFLIPLLQAAWTRFAVTANAKVVSRVTTGGQVVAGDASTIPTGAVLAVRERNSDVPVVNPVPVQPELVAAA